LIRWYGRRWPIVVITTATGIITIRLVKLTIIIPTTTRRQLQAVPPATTAVVRGVADLEVLVIILYQVFILPRGVASLVVIDDEQRVIL